MNTVRTRFAPSPTGFVHIGSLRTALFSFLFARHNHGTHVLRVEDTDQNRLVEGALENLLRVMREIGVEFDEGFYLDDNNKIQEKGEFGPYLQSKRLELYKKYAKQLVQQGHAYYCFCSEQRLEELRKEQIALKKPPMYDRLCRNLSRDEIQAKLAEFKSAGKNPVIRQTIPAAGQTVVHDLIYGDIVYDHKVLDDQVILKSDGFPTYHLAVVVDDHLMQISHVIRGEEWTPSTPKHLLLYQALGWEPTQFAHLPLILNPDKSKLSKRQGDVAVEDFLAKGYLKEALVNFVAFLGWNPKTEQEFFSMDELIKQFDLPKVNKSGAIFDINKLDWLNSSYIRRMQPGQLASVLMPYWQQAGVKTKDYSAEYFSAIAALEQARLKKLSEIGERTKYFFSEPNYKTEMLFWPRETTKPKEVKDKTLNALQKIYEKINLEILSILPKDIFQDTIRETTNAFFRILNETCELLNLGKGDVYWPFRVALTGLEKSPPPFQIAAILFIGIGKEGILNRLKTAIAKLD